MNAWIQWQRHLFWLWRVRTAERVSMAIAWKLPKWLVYWCSIRLIAHATTGQYGSTIAPELPAMEALKRWEDA
jgi:hypothetical protein